MADLKQRRLDQCCAGVQFPQPRLSFLRLPPTIRRQIYIDAGFPNERHIHIPFPTGRYQGRVGNDLGQVTLSLLLTCRTVSSEVQHILLANNVFTAVLHRPGDLYHLRQYADKIMLMRHLLIYVMPHERMHQSLLCLCPGMAVPSLSEQRPICQTHTRPHIKEAFLDFRETLKLILANTQPGTLELGLLLFVQNDLELADWLLLPLLETEAPLLADCAIYLHTEYKYKADIAELIYKYTTQSRASPRITTPSQPFRFADLPSELRRLVLSFTDLVVPGDAIEWLPSYEAWSMHIDPDQELGCGYGELEIGRFPEGSYLHHGFSCAFKTCGRSQYCRCWGPPVAILLCSRWLYKEAMSVFLAMNTFIALPDWAGRFTDGETQTQPGTL